MVEPKDTVGLSGSIPVMVDRSDHDKVAIDWERVRAPHEAGKVAGRETIGARGPAEATVTFGEGQVIDASQNPELAQQLGQTLGQFGIGTQPPPHADARRDGGDDTHSQLERLSALRASGALTEDEFEQQKRRILGA
jgi:hypothetical protein